MEDKSTYITIIVILILAIILLYQDLNEMESKLDNLTIRTVQASVELKFCLGEVSAYERAFDYHIVMSELGIYPKRDDLYRFTEKVKEKKKGEKNEPRTKNKNKAP